MLGLRLTALVALAVAVAVVLVRDPDEPWAVALLVLAIGVVAGALAAMAQLRRRGRGHRRPPAAVRGTAARRAAEVGAVVALLLWLRAVDGLSVVTAVFVVGTFVVAEAVLSARPVSWR